MIKSDFHEVGIFNFESAIWDKIPQALFTEGDFVGIQEFVQKIFKINDLETVIIKDIPADIRLADKNRGAYTSLETKEVTLVNELTLTSPRSLLGKLAHEAMHVLSDQLFENDDDTYLATALGCWFEYQNFDTKFVVGSTRYIGLGRRMIECNELSKKAVSLHKKISKQKPADKALTENRWGYHLGNIIFEMMYVAFEEGVSEETLYEFVRSLAGGGSLEDSFLILQTALNS